MESEYKQGLHVFVGKQGEGKTLAMIGTMSGELEKSPDRKVFSNINLSIPHEKITFDKDIEGSDYIDILKMIKEDPTYFNNSIMILDEIHIYVDSYAFHTKNNKVLQQFMTQLRKRNILILATTQYFSQLDNRIRSQARYCFKMKKITNTRYIMEVYIPDRYDVEYSHTVELVNMGRYFKYYDTHEVVS